MTPHAPPVPAASSVGRARSQHLIDFVGVGAIFEEEQHLLVGAVATKLFTQSAEKHFPV